MDQTELAEEQKRVVRRYLEVWRRFRRLPDRQGGFVGLEDDMNKGSGMLLCGLLVEANAANVIIADVKDPKFHAAIFGGDDAAASDMTDEELRQARRYIIHAEGSAPVRRGPTHRFLPSALYSDTPNPAGPLRTERCTAER
jgi:hypothetical protein